MKLDGREVVDYHGDLAVLLSMLGRGSGVDHHSQIFIKNKN
jgi:hypothetical protein